MECNNACKSDIKCQKEKVRDLKNQIKAKERAHKDAFMCILNDCQKKDYKKICKKIQTVSIHLLPLRPTEMIHCLQVAVSFLP